MLDTAARLALSPLLVAQALRVRRIAQSLPEAAGPRSGRMGDGPPLRLAIVGDSSAAGVGVADQAEALSGQLARVLSDRHTVHWHLDALTGATTRSTLERLTEARPQPMDVVIVALGVNDVTRLVPASLWVRQQNRLLDRLRALHAPRRIYLSGMPPIRYFPLLPEPLRWTLGRHADKLETARIAALSDQPDCTHVPFELPLDPALMASDGFHPSARLYTLWAEEMASRISADWPSIQT
ncbi:SGNH/GDSL hydrolase family protein [Marimonas sp. MJW-29]|uniref:SGNH/GDSL hydrolase family protein n=1 Tax=Sulfitobacter sediminis TaxID=3234186 RepID=A0ABV3RQM6_9RHOB